MSPARSIRRPSRSSSSSRDFLSEPRSTVCCGLCPLKEADAQMGQEGPEDRRIQPLAFLQPVWPAATRRLGPAPRCCLHAQRRRQAAGNRQAHFRRRRRLAPGELFARCVCQCSVPPLPIPISGAGVVGYIVVAWHCTLASPAPGTETSCIAQDRGVAEHPVERRVKPSEAARQPLDSQLPVLRSHHCPHHASAK